jgi:hypothetical protein
VSPGVGVPGISHHFAAADAIEEVASALPVAFGNAELGTGVVLTTEVAGTGVIVFAVGGPQRPVALREILFILFETGFVAKGVLTADFIRSILS